MKCRPRSPNQSLVSKAVMIYSYVCVGTMITLGSLAAYFSVYW